MKGLCFRNMQVLGAIITVMAGLLVVASVVVMFPWIFAFRPFDHHKVGFRAGVLIILAFALMVVGLSLYEGNLSPLRVTAFLEFLGILLVFLLIGTLVASFNYRGMRRLSETYAKREAILAERKHRERGVERHQTE